MPNDAPEDVGFLRPAAPLIRSLLASGDGGTPVTCRPRAHHPTSIVFDPTPTDRKGIRMRIFMFKSEAKSELRAFAGDSAGSKLPRQHGPWHATGVIRPDKDPPYNLPRTAIEKAIKADGFQLWRLKSKLSPPA